MACAFFGVLGFILVVEAISRVWGVYRVRLAVKRSEEEKRNESRA